MQRILNRPQPSAVLWMAGIICSLVRIILTPPECHAAAADGTVSQTQAGAATSALSDAPWLVYVGTYTGPKSKGIYLVRMDRTTGHLSPAELVAELPSPTFLEIDCKRRLLFAVNEIGDFEGKSSGAVSSFSIQPGSGRLNPLGQASSIGAGPCHLSLDRTGGYVLLANYSGGSIAALKISQDGHIGPATAFIQHTGRGKTDRQDAPHAHCINLDPANRFAFCCDLGLDKVMAYHFDVNSGALTANEPAFTSLAPGTGPRHFAFHPDGIHAFSINELNSTLTCYDYDPGQGALTVAQTVSTLPAGFTGNNFPAELEVHPNGKFIYASNRGHDSIAVFAYDSKRDRVRLIQNQSTQGKWPRFFGLDPDGKFLVAANQNSDSIVVFRVDPATGELAPTGQKLEIASPVCLKWF